MVYHTQGVVNVCERGRSRCEMGPMMAKPTLNDVALSAGLSVATVSRALHRLDSPNVSSETRKRVQKIAREIGYRPNLLGRSLVTGRTHLVSYWTFDAFAPYYVRVARAICAEAAQRKYYVHIHSTIDPANNLNAQATSVGGNEGGNAALELNFDGVIACDVAYPGNDHARQLRQRGVPLVGIGINYPTDGDYVAIDLALGAEMAVRHLLEIGCRRIAHMTFLRALEEEEPRAPAYHRLMREAGLAPEWIPVPYFGRAAAREAIKAYVPEKGVPEAIFCANDEVAIGCYRGLADMGINVPNDTLLVGCDGNEDTEYQRCPITTIAAPLEDMCRLAWDFLENRIRSPDCAPQQIALPPTLIRRESTCGMAS
jgi:DNA-binding LacI/PurR family transcriptional regulator